MLEDRRGLVILRGLRPVVTIFTATTLDSGRVENADEVPMAGPAGVFDETSSVLRVIAFPLSIALAFAFPLGVALTLAFALRVFFFAFTLMVAFAWVSRRLLVLLLFLDGSWCSWFSGFLEEIASGQVDLVETLSSIPHDSIDDVGEVFVSFFWMTLGQPLEVLDVRLEVLGVLQLLEEDATQFSLRECHRQILNHVIPVSLPGSHLGIASVGKVDKLDYVISELSTILYLIVLMHHVQELSTRDGDRWLA